MRVQPLLPSSPLVAIVTLQIGVCAVGVQRGEEPGAAGAEDQNVGLESFQRHRILQGPREKDECDDGRYCRRERRQLLLSVMPFQVFQYQQPQATQHMQQQQEYETTFR